MNIQEIETQSVWTSHLDRIPHATFLQTWEWGELQKAQGYGVSRLAITGKEGIKAIAQVIKIKAKRGSMLFVPHGPLIHDSFEKDTETVFNLLLTHLTQIARREGFAFIRIAPVHEDSTQMRHSLKRMGMRISPIYMHAERVWVLDLVQDEEALMQQMRKTTRYSIRKAAKEKVVIEKRTDNRAIDDFWGIYEKTAVREHFTPFSKTFINREFGEFFKTGNAVYLLGRVPAQDGKPGPYEAGALIVFTKHAAFYHQGASLHSKIPVAYLMQWEAIKEAKKRGCSVYNFWGILQKGRTPGNWSGLSLFKQGFAGRQIDHVPTHDYIVNPLGYVKSWLYEYYLKIKRGI